MENMLKDRKELEKNVKLLLNDFVKKHPLCLVELNGWFVTCTSNTGVKKVIKTNVDAKIII
jgi:hypothetical protein